LILTIADIIFSIKDITFEINYQTKYVRFYDDFFFFENVSH